MSMLFRHYPRKHASPSSSSSSSCSLLLLLFLLLFSLLLLFFFFFFFFFFNSAHQKLNVMINMPSNDLMKVHRSPSSSLQINHHSRHDTARDGSTDTTAKRSTYMQSNNRGRMSYNTLSEDIGDDEYYSEVNVRNPIPDAWLQDLARYDPLFELESSPSSLKYSSSPATDYDYSNINYDSRKAARQLHHD